MYMSAMFATMACRSDVQGTGAESGCFRQRLLREQALSLVRGLGQRAGCSLFSLVDLTRDVAHLCCTGYSVSVDGSLFAVGERSEDLNANQAGRVSLFEEPSTVGGDKRWRSRYVSSCNIGTQRESRHGGCPVVEAMLHPGDQGEIPGVRKDKSSYLTCSVFFHLAGTLTGY